VSIVIPNWNGGEVLVECVESILTHTRGTDVELILVDNGSSDASRDAIAAFAKADRRVTAILNDRNLMFAHACNQGAELALGRYLLVANNDIVLVDDAVSELAAYADDNRHVAAVTPVFVDAEGRQQEFVRRLPHAGHIICHYHRLGRIVDRVLLGRHFQNRYFYRDRSFTDVEEIEQAGASFTLFRKSAIDILGVLFDDSYPLLFNDVDLYRRLRHAGLASHVVPSIRVVHLAGVSSAKLDPRLYRQLHFRAMFDYFRRNHPWQVPLLCLAWPHRWIFGP